MVVKMKKSKNILKKILIILLFIIIVSFAALCTVNLYVCLSASPYIEDNDAELDTDVDAIIVLGAGLTSDGRPGTVLKDRLDTAIELYNDGISNRLLMSGDHGDAYHNEVKAMKEYAIEQGVPDDDIFMDHAGFTTYETMVRARDIFEVKSAVVVTQKYHLYRSMYIARRLGLDAEGYASEIQIEGKYIPLEVRESFARVKAFLYMIIMPEPTYLGDKIPITGSGSATDD